MNFSSDAVTQIVALILAAAIFGVFVHLVLKSGKNIKKSKSGPLNDN